MKLASKFGILATLTVLATAGALGYFAVQLVEDFIERETLQTGRALANTIANSSTPHVLDRSPLAVEQLLDRAREQNDYIEYIFVVDFDGRLMAHTFTDGFPTQLLFLLRESRHELPVRFDDRYSEREILNISVPLVEHMDATLHLGLNGDYAQPLVSRTRLLLLLAALAIALIAALIATMISRRLSAPLSELGNYVRRYGHSGDADSTRIASIKGSTEIREMAHTIAQMIDERRLATRRLFAEKETALVTLHSIGDAVITTDNRGTVTYLNPIAVELTGWSNDEATGRPVDEVLKLVNELTGEAAPNPVSRCLEEDGIIGLANHTSLARRDGTSISIEDSAAPIRSEDGSTIGVVMVFHDVSAERELKKQLSYNASHDSLTGLINRREFDLRLQGLIRDATERRSEHALVYIDLDQFKIINDTSGHVAGDELLKQVGHLLGTRIRDTDTLARLGGDEFGALLVGCPLEEAGRIANNMLEAIKDVNFAWEDRTFRIGASIGVVGIDQFTRDPVSVMSAADVACYAAKETGRSRVNIYTEENEALSQRRKEMHWASHISRAIDEDRLVLYAQPILGLNGSSEPLAHLELLVRMLDEDGNLVPPGTFLPAAERFNLMTAVDRWVVKTALKGCAGCPFNERGNLITTDTIGINLSGTTIGDHETLDSIRDDVVSAPIGPERVCFEITETAAISNLTMARQFMSDMKKLGVRFALDDFGSGLSSFAYLKNLPVDFLKIDGSFVKDITRDPLDRTMVEAIDKIGKAMRMQTIGEYAESDEVIEMLREIGVDFAQGYAIGRPRPLCEVCREGHEDAEDVAAAIT